MANASKFTFAFMIVRPNQSLLGLGVILYQDEALVDGAVKASAKIRSSDVVISKVNLLGDFSPETIDLTNVPRFMQQLEGLRNHEGYVLNDSSFNTRRLFNVFKECEQTIFEVLSVPQVTARGMSILEASIFRQAFHGSDMNETRFKLMAFEGWPPGEVKPVVAISRIGEASSAAGGGQNAKAAGEAAPDEEADPIGLFQKELSSIAQHLENQCVTFSFAQSEDAVPVVNLNPGDVVFLQSSSLPSELHENLKFVPGAVEKKNALMLPARVVRLYLYPAKNKVIVLSNIVNKIYAFSVAENLEQRVKMVAGKNKDVYERILNDSYGSAVMSMIDTKTPMEFSPIIRMDNADHKESKIRRVAGRGESVLFDQLVIGTAVLFTGLALYIVYVFFSK